MWSTINIVKTILPQLTIFLYCFISHEQWPPLISLNFKYQIHQILLPLFIFFTNIIGNDIIIESKSKIDKEIINKRSKNPFLNDK